MNDRLRSGILALALIAPSVAWAQGVTDPPTAASCMTNLYDAFGREQRLERAVLFGQPAAKDAPLQSVRYDNGGNAWIKRATNSWRSTAEGFSGTTWSDARMQQEGERDLLCTGNSDGLQSSCVKLPRRGIFETRKTPTSDLIQPIVQSIRALQCRLEAVCQVAALSPGKEKGAMITVSPEGCLPMTFPVFEGCRAITPDVFSIVPGSCEAARTQLVEREMQLLTLATSYDASYRSLAQFAGIFQQFLTQFRFPLIEPLWQTVRMLGGLKGMPCFQAECNE